MLYSRSPLWRIDRQLSQFRIHNVIQGLYRDGIARALYVTAVGRRVVVVRAFIKKTQKTPNREIELALKRAKELLP